MRFVSSVSYSVVVNCEVGEQFMSSHELRQGHLLSSYLFLLVGMGYWHY